MCTANRVGRGLKDVEPAAARNMCKVDDHAETVHFFHDRFAKICQAAAGAFFLNAIGKFVAQIPSDLHAAEAKAKEIPEIFDTPFERLSAFKAHDDAEYIPRGAVGTSSAVRISRILPCDAAISSRSMSIFSSADFRNCLRPRLWVTLSPAIA